MNKNAICIPTGNGIIFTGIGIVGNHFADLGIFISVFIQKSYVVEVADIVCSQICSGYFIGGKSMLPSGEVQTLWAKVLGV